MGPNQQPSHSSNDEWQGRFPNTPTPSQQPGRPYPFHNNPRSTTWAPDVRPGRGSPTFSYSKPQLQNDLHARYNKAAQVEETVVTPPRSITRTEAVPPSLRITKARHARDRALRDASLDARVKMGIQMDTEEEKRMKSRLGLEGREVEEEMEGHNMAGKKDARFKGGEVEEGENYVRRQDAGTEDAEKRDVRSLSAYPANDTYNAKFDRASFFKRLCLGVLILLSMLASTLYLAMRPASALAVMTLNMTHLFNGTEPDGNALTAKCGYEMRPPGSHLNKGNGANFHLPLQLDREVANITIPDYIELHMFGACFKSRSRRTCHVGSPLLPFNWNITRMVESGITPVLNELDPRIKAELGKANLEEDVIKGIERKACEGKPKPATVDLLAWGWPLAEWPKPSSLSMGEDGKTTRSTLFQHEHMFDGEIRKGDVTSIPYNVILITMVAGMVFLGIHVLWLLTMGNEDDVQFFPCWLGCVLLGMPFAVLAIVGATLEVVGYGNLGWRENACNIIEYAGTVLRPYWIMDWLQWYFWGLVVLFGAFAGAYLMKGVFSRRSLGDDKNYGGCGFIGFGFLSLVALIAASLTGQRSMSAKAKTINSIEGFLGIHAVRGKGVWTTICLAEFVALWVGLVCVATAFNSRFRARMKIVDSRTFDNTTIRAGVRMSNGAGISAPIIPAIKTRDIEKTERTEAEPAEAEDDRRPVRQSQAETPEPDGTTAPSEELAPRKGFTVVVEEVDETDSDGAPQVTAQDQPKDKAKPDVESAIVKPESEGGSGVTSSPAHTRDDTIDAIEERQESEIKAGEEHDEPGDERRSDDAEAGSQEQEGREADDQSQDDAQVKDKEVPEMCRFDEVNVVEERWSCQAEASRSGRTTAASTFRSGYDGADESSRSRSRSATRCERLELYEDGRPRGGHVLDLIVRAERLSLTSRGSNPGVV